MKTLLLSFTVLLILSFGISNVSAETKSNTCEEGMMYDSNTDSCIKDTYKHIRDSKIPSWVKQTAFWWSQGMVTDDEFLSALQYLIDEGLLNTHTEKQENNISENFDKPFNLKVISCSPHGTDSLKVEYSVTNNSGQLVDIELVIKGVDINGEVLSISTPRMYDLGIGQTKYDHTYIDDYPNLDSCGIDINAIQ